MSYIIKTTLSIKVQRCVMSCLQAFNIKMCVLYQNISLNRRIPELSDHFTTLLLIVGNLWLITFRYGDDTYLPSVVFKRMFQLVKVKINFEYYIQQEHNVISTLK